MRGCPNRCRFCQARSQYYPLRIRKPDNLCAIAEETYKNTGYDEISLAGLSVSDYPKIEELSSRLMELFKDKGVSLSLPSIKAKSYVGNLSSIIARVKKTGLTFAPEAGSERLRQILAKDFNEDDFFSALRESFKAGYQRVKLYFMIGLPTEKVEDLDAIISFSTKVSELRREVSSRPAVVNISINALIPKPHTPFQWFKMEGPDAIKEKQDYLKKICKNRRLELNFHNRQMSFIEAILSRGDRKLSPVVLQAFKNGAKFDAWSNHFSFDAWSKAFASSGINPEDYISEKSENDRLAWDFIDFGLSKEELLGEFKKIIDM
ncbi:MAG: radical SAM protein [Candidatus Omnitrophica bacterium]|nr:radical SAM protein [Candidatus Omnitrophota bacterium]